MLVKIVGVHDDCEMASVSGQSHQKWDSGDCQRSLKLSHECHVHSKVSANILFVYELVETHLRLYICPYLVLF